jgi:uncharacterized protein YdbL (DUF1318 family)
VLLAGFAALALATAPAGANPLAEAKAQGLVGERIDGYLGVVDANAPASLRAQVEDINARRRERYAEIARNRGVPIEAVAQIAGERLIAEAARGELVMGADGGWRRK